jgi:ribonuclease R
VNFEPDSAFRGDKGKPKPAKAKKEKGAKKPSAKTQKIAAATKAKRAAKKKSLSKRLRPLNHLGCREAPVHR